MNPQSILGLAGIIMKIAEAGPTIFDSVPKAVAIAQDLFKHLTSQTDPTLEEWVALHNKIDALISELDAPELNP